MENKLVMEIGRYTLEVELNERGCFDATVCTDEGHESSHNWLRHEGFLEGCNKTDFHDHHVSDVDAQKIWVWIEETLPSLTKSELLELESNGEIYDIQDGFFDDEYWQPKEVA
jgi:hypothetical protein|tara:strand:+ start:24 stop:362 length:339 start_codon:yes stop_codon:yes gene_type:complete